MSPIRCVVFDFDGVLVESNAVKHNAYFEIFAPLDASREEVQRCVVEEEEGDRYQVIECILRRLEAAGVLRASNRMSELVAYYAHQYNRICEAYTVSCPEVPGASECLPRLGQRYALYINSATANEPLRRVVRKRGWAPYFQQVLGSSRTKRENLIWIMESEKVDGTCIVFVGDGQRDLAAARARGCHFVGMRNLYNNFVDRDLIKVNDLYGLEDLIGQRWG